MVKTIWVCKRRVKNIICGNEEYIEVKIVNAFDGFVALLCKCKDLR